jgi:hypothetical protein
VFGLRSDHRSAPAIADTEVNRNVRRRTTDPSALSRSESNLAPNGTACQPEITGLLKRAHLIADDIRYVGKETDRKWEEGEDMSVLEFAATEYGRTGKVLASQEVKDEIGRIGINKCACESRFDRKNFIRKLVRDISVKRNSYSEFVNWLQRRKSQCAQPFHGSMASVNDHPTQIRCPSSPR